MFHFLKLSIVCTVTVLAAMASGLPTASANSIQYTVTDLAPYGESNSMGNGINANGDTVGWSSTANSIVDTNGFLNTTGTSLSLGTLPGGNVSGADSINSSGQITGYSNRSDTNPHAFLYSSGVMSDLGTLPGGTFSYGLDINDSGQIVGYSNTAKSTSHAFLYQNGSMVDLGTLGIEYSQAYAINNLGQIVGISGITPNVCHPFLYQNGTMTDLSAPAADTYSYALDINQSGDIVGAFSSLANPNQQRAFLYHAGVYHELVTLGSGSGMAQGINDNGEIVGQFGMLGNVVPNEHAFIYRTGIMTDLNTLIDPNLGWTLVRAQKINSKGQIVGYGTLHGETHAFLLTPTTPGLPGALSNLTATAVNRSQINLNWKTAPGATSYEIYRGTISGGFHAIIGTSTITSYHDTHLSAGTRYYYIVRAINTYGQGPKSPEVSAITSILPDAPVVTAMATSKTQINLTWPAADGATTYVIYRSTTPGGPGRAIIGNTTGLSFSDKALKAATQYYYVVVAGNANGWTKSQEVSTFTLGLPGMPTNCRAGAISLSQIDLDWTAAADATVYVIYRSTASGTGRVIIGNTTGTSFTDTDIQTTTRSRYYYVVVAGNSYGWTKSTEFNTVTLAP